MTAQVADGMSMSALQQHFAQLQYGSYDQHWQGFAVRLVKQSWGELAIALQGGQLLYFRPEGQPPLLWLSEQLKAAPAAIRGGVPLCWPWFADHPDDASLPAHGVARTAHWFIEEQLLDDSNGRWLLVPKNTLWPGLCVQQQIDADMHGVTIRLLTVNTGDEAVPVSAALHSYLAISSREQLSLQGLHSAQRVDKLQAMALSQQDGPLDLTAPVDSIFACTQPLSLLDRGWQRRIRVENQGSQSTVVWNPGPAAEQMADIGLNQVDNFICIEAARTAQFDQIMLGSGARHCLQTTITTEALQDD